MTIQRYPIFQVPDSELSEWYDIGWSFVEPAEVPGFSVIKWESDKIPVAPFKHEERAA